MHIQSNNGHDVEIDKEDLHLLDGAKVSVSRDSKNGSYYAHASWLVNGGGTVSIGLGRVLLGLQKGDKLEAEHLDPYATLDYRRSNLRIATRAQNNANRRMRKDNTSGYKGVVAHPDGRRWIAQIMVNGKGINLGIFETREKAYAAYCLAAAEHHGEFARPERRADAENIQAQAAL